MKNRIWVYTVCYNESSFVKNFLAAYAGAERIVVYDNQSTDDTVELLLQDRRVEIRTFDSGGKIRDDLYLDIKNHAWKEARGQVEWVIVVDFDEIFNHCTNNGGIPKFDLDLTEVKRLGYNAIKPYGYNMIEINAPLRAEGHPFLYSKMATYHHPNEKVCCFNPNEISETNYYSGCHRSELMDNKQGVDNVKVCCFEEYKLLHYKFWNLDAYLKRMAEYQTRLSDINKGMGWGWHYMMSLQYHRDCFVNGSKIAVSLFDVKKP
jgi:glycosyltransferase involved in cell wall biosynthesis